MTFDELIEALRALGHEPQDCDPIIDGGPRCVDFGLDADNYVWVDETGNVQYDGWMKTVADWTLIDLLRSFALPRVSAGAMDGEET